MSKIAKSLIKHKVAGFESGEVDFLELSKYKGLIADKEYFSFVIDSKNGGFFYGQSLHIYGYSQIHAYHDMESINLLLQKEYGDITNGLVSFAQDLFGNQFCFDTAGNNIVFLDVETGGKDVIARDFSSWVDALQERLHYFTGINVLEEWVLNDQLKFDQRLCPKVPFVMGGEFKVNNLYASSFPNSIRAYANIARQVYNLPEGTPVKLNIGKKTS
jgi:hypothetical protein